MQFDDYKNILYICINKPNPKVRLYTKKGMDKLTLSTSINKLCEMQ
jgi:hypothetical protein